MDGHVAVVTDIPVKVCPSCETVWYDEGVGIALDAMLNEMLAHESVALRPFAEPAPSVA